MTTSSGAARPGARASRGRAGASVPKPDHPDDPTLVGRLNALLERIETPLTTYHLLLSTTIALTVFGLVMVMSAASIRTYTVFFAQLRFALIGAVLAFVASRIPTLWWKRMALPALLLAIALQALTHVPGLGVTVNGNRNWIRIGGQQLQPSEFAKLAIIVFGAAVLARKRHVIGQFWHALIPLVFPAAIVLLGLQLLGSDLGTGMVLLAIVAGMLFAAGVSSRLFVAAGALGAAAVAVMTLSSGNRMGRITAWAGDSCATNLDLCRQVMNGHYALADGGWWGLGPGASREKWGWLPESTNDFILAIIGEEFGLPGTLLVLALIALLCFACYRLVRRSDDFFVRICAAGVMTWLIVQSAINIGAVTGLLPVIGVPLPLISSGGTAIISTLMALGMLMSFARHEPGAQAALTRRRRPPRRTLAVMSRRRSTP
ncbi:putative lipid II flippase FtsW [Arsenicicoccus piscis]|uniref:peptidoglycan glycosyltransferase FtsW n=1 Tax=Arsenicicoccus piscis TaxID=673954 RepID=UPI001F4D2C0D|nr:putative peptidoglycan glycosyltransferase FtsW [Arsenicicoccus piscis]MCH8627106.1 putative lipid II flippase FtsW [Arsenicicoccus piscis]